MKIDMKNIVKLGLVAALALVPEAAHAFTAGMNAAGSGADISGQISQMATQTAGTPALIAWGAYVIGTFFVCVGIFKLKAHSDNAAQNKLGVALGMLFTGAAFLVFPSAAALLVKSSNMTGAASTYNAAAFK